MHILQHLNCRFVPRLSGLYMDPHAVYLVMRRAGKCSLQTYLDESQPHLPVSTDRRAEE